MAMQTALLMARKVSKQMELPRARPPTEPVNDPPLVVRRGLGTWKVKLVKPRLGPVKDHSRIYRGRSSRRLQYILDGDNLVLNY